ncbi:DUF2231 domain-containing protein [Pontibacter ruber]|uniref:DUF2231 domain-containing protein n=1 Tax=Pontibacter ruber TaxID=1343895 RepID=A0ABW5D1F1_9BACT|nr:DUF2231 domain-containing protein [Pontibacter ruber]
MEPTFWRTEIYHPLSVHFPIALLLVATLAKAATLLLKDANYRFWQRVGSYLLYAGCVAAWFSIYTGDLADGIVSRKICDPTVLKDHENAAFTLAYLFTAATALDLFLAFRLIRMREKMLHLLVVVLMLAGSAFLMYTGHLGARVVYEQAGGVNVPASDCAGFE